MATETQRFQNIFKWTQTEKSVYHPAVLNLTTTSLLQRVWNWNRALPIHSPISYIHWIILVSTFFFFTTTSSRHSLIISTHFLFHHHSELSRINCLNIRNNLYARHQIFSLVNLLTNKSQVSIHDLSTSWFFAAICLALQFYQYSNTRTWFPTFSPLVIPIHAMHLDHWDPNYCTFILPCSYLNHIQHCVTNQRLLSCDENRNDCCKLPL